MFAGLARKMPLQLVDTRDREAGQLLLTAREDSGSRSYPAGGRGLVSLVQKEARVPTLLHLDRYTTTAISRKGADLEGHSGHVSRCQDAPDRDLRSTTGKCRGRDRPQDSRPEVSTPWRSWLGD